MTFGSSFTFLAATVFASGMIKADRTAAAAAIIILAMFLILVCEFNPTRRPPC